MLSALETSACAFCICRVYVRKPGTIVSYCRQISQEIILKKRLTAGCQVCLFSRARHVSLSAIILFKLKNPINNISASSEGFLVMSCDCHIAESFLFSNHGDEQLV